RKYTFYLPRALEHPLASERRLSGGSSGLFSLVVVSQIAGTRSAAVPTARWAPTAARQPSGNAVDKPLVALSEALVCRHRTHSSNIREHPVDASDKVSVAKRRCLPKPKWCRFGQLADDERKIERH